MRNAEIFELSFRTYRFYLLTQAETSSPDWSAPIGALPPRPGRPRSSDFIVDFLKIARTALSAKAEPMVQRAFEEFYARGAEDPGPAIKRLRVRADVFDILLGRVRHIAGGAFFKARLWPSHVYFGN